MDPNDTEVREKSRWINVEKTVKMLSGTSCPAQTAFKMANITINPSIANKIDYSLNPRTVKESSVTQRIPAQTYKPPSRQPSRDSSAMISQHLLAECSVAFRDFCKVTAASPLLTPTSISNAVNALPMCVSLCSSQGYPS